MKYESLIVDHNSMPCIPSPLEANDIIRVSRKSIEDFPLALVTPLRPHDHGGRHVRLLAGVGTPTFDRATLPAPVPQCERIRQAA